MTNKKKRLWILVTITLILLVANPKTIQYLKAKTDLGKERASIIKEIEIPHSNQIIYERLDDGLIKYWEGILIYYNMFGEQMWSVNLAINRPVIKTNSDSIYIIDENKNQILRINKKGEQIYRNTLNKGYKNFNICRDNYVVLHHNNQDAIEYITVINEEGKKVSEIVLGEGNITNMIISKHYDKMAMSTIGINGDNLENKVLLYDLKANLIGSDSFKNKIVLDLLFNEKGDLIIIDEENIFAVNKDGKINWEIEFDNQIAAIGTKNKDFITAYNKGSGRKGIVNTHTESAIKAISYNGKLLGEIKLKEGIIDMDSYKNNIIACLPRTIFKYDKKGKLKAEDPYTSDILKCFALSDNNIVVITKEKISFLSFKGR